MQVPPWEQIVGFRGAISAHHLVDGLSFERKQPGDVPDSNQNESSDTSLTSLAVGPTVAVSPKDITIASRLAGGVRGLGEAAAER